MTVAVADRRAEAARSVAMVCPLRTCGGMLEHDPDAGSLYESRRCSLCGLVARFPIVALARSIGVKSK